MIGEAKMARRFAVAPFILRWKVAVALVICGSLFNGRWLQLFEAECRISVRHLREVVWFVRPTESRQIR